MSGHATSDHLIVSVNEVSVARIYLAAMEDDDWPVKFAFNFGGETIEGQVYLAKGDT